MSVGAAFATSLLLCCIVWQDDWEDLAWSASYAMNQCYASFFPQLRLEHSEWDSSRTPIIGSCGTQEQALLIDLTSNSCRRVRRKKDKERVFYSQTGLAVLGARSWGEGMWKSSHWTADESKAGRVGKIRRTWWNLPSCWLWGNFPLRIPLSTVVGSALLKCKTTRRESSVAL